ncbi:MAG: hypothetical protein PHQ04_07220 [Opitutaceae bacterium]|nr:hypothetical protein [Opitutaceae bacterium]
MNDTENGATEPEPPAATSPAAPAAPAAPTSYHLLGDRTDREFSGLFKTSLGVLIATMVYYAFTANVQNPLHLYQGLAILVFSVVPTLIWLRQGGVRFPVFEPMMFLCATSYALPLLNGHAQLVDYPHEVLSRAGWYVLAYQASALLVYAAVRGQPGRGRFWTESIISSRLERNMTYGVVLSSVYTGVSVFTDWIPTDLASVLRAVFFGISILCVFTTCQRWGKGELTRTEKGIFSTAFALQLIFLSTGLLLIMPLTQIGIALLGYLSVGRRMPWVMAVVLFGLFAILHNGKTPMREVYWEGLKPEPNVWFLPGFFSEWIGHGLTVPTSEKQGMASALGSKLLERTSIMHILCLVVACTPDRQPHLDGETYGYVLPQLIPRFFWPDKPRSHISTYRLSVYYGLQSEEGTLKTTIAFGMLTEAYANFGIGGVLLLGALFGGGIKTMQVLSAQSPMFSLAGLTMVLLTAWSFNVELTMAAWVSSLYQAMIAVLGVPLVLRSFVGL